MNIDSNKGSTATGLILDCQKQRFDLSNPPNEDHTQIMLDGHDYDASSGSDDYTGAISLEVENDERGGTFQDRLLKSLEKTPGHGGSKGFFPRETLLALVDEETVAKELRRSYKRLAPNTIRMISQEVCGTRSFRKIFALLVLTHKLTDIRTFIRHDVADDDLPLCKVPYQGVNIFQLARRGDSKSPLICFKAWSPLDIWNFEEWQWTMLAPFFSHGEHKNIRHFVFPDQITLPFTLNSQYGEGSKAIHGGFSTIFKVDIHPEHHSFVGPEVRLPIFSITTDKYAGTRLTCGRSPVTALP